MYKEKIIEKLNIFASEIYEELYLHLSKRRSLILNASDEDNLLELLIRFDPKKFEWSPQDNNYIQYIPDESLNIEEAISKEFNISIKLVKLLFFHHSNSFHVNGIEGMKLKKTDDIDIYDHWLKIIGVLEYTSLLDDELILSFFKIEKTIDYKFDNKHLNNINTGYINGGFIRNLRIGEPLIIGTLATSVVTNIKELENKIEVHTINSVYVLTKINLK